MRITETVIAVNEQIKRRMIDKLLDICEGSFNTKTIVVLGVTFKPNTDDVTGKTNQKNEDTTAASNQMIIDSPEMLHLSPRVHS